MRTLIAFAFALPAFAQPAITTLAAEHITHNSARVRVKTDSPACFRVLYTSGDGELGNATQSSCGPAVNVPITSMTLAMGPLAAGTRYRWRIEARPTASTICPDNPTVCTLSDEQAFITESAPPHPVLPRPVNEWRPRRPITDGYAVVPVVRGPSGDCVAVVDMNGPGWAVLAGDSMQTILNKVGYGTVIEQPASSRCDIPAINAGGSQGYAPRAKPVDPRASSIDDPTHPLIVIRVRQDNPAELPPFGAQTGPAWFPAMAEWRSTTQKLRGNCIRASTEDGTVHHYWIENIRCTVDPAAFKGTWAPMIEWGDTGNHRPEYKPPKYNVLDRVSIEGDKTGKPQHCHTRGTEVYAAYFAMIGTYTNDIECPAIEPAWPGLTQGVLILEGTPGPLTFENNAIIGTSMGWYAENNSRGVVPTHVAFTRNTLYLPWARMKPMDGVNLPNKWNGWWGAYRQAWESKGLHFLNMDGNFIRGGFADQNEGPAILLVAMSTENPGQTGHQDISITNNIIMQVANGVNCSSTRTGDPAPGPPDVIPTQRVLLENNVFLDMGRGRFQNGRNLAGLVDYYIFNAGCHDMTVRKNSFDWKDQSPTPGIQYTTSIVAGGYGAHAAEGFSFIDNLFHYNLGNYAGVISGARASVGTHPPFPSVGNSSSAQTDIKAMASGLFPGANWTGNVVIGGRRSFYGNTRMVELSQAEVDGIHNTGLYPGTDQWMPGATMAERQAAAGFDPRTGRITKTKWHDGHAGANVDQARAHHGIVTGVSVIPSSNGATFTYTAPDSRACAIDTAAGSTWKRIEDAGGPGVRSTTVRELTPGTMHRWRLICYRLQEPIEAYDFLAANEATAGTFTTPSSGGTRVAPSQIATP